MNIYYILMLFKIIILTKVIGEKCFEFISKMYILLLIFFYNLYSYNNNNYKYDKNII